MFIAIIKIIPCPETRKEILDILNSMKGPTSVKAGCIRCAVLQEQGDDDSIFYVEQWESQELLTAHLRSTIYSRLLKAMDLAREMPEVMFHRISDTSGMELIGTSRDCVVT
jgi:quinol monooxygenase YgiN